MHGDIVPVGEFLGDAAVARRIVLLEIVEGGVGKNDAETEGVVGAIALIDRDDGLRTLLLQQDRGVKAGRSAADDRNLHERLRNRQLSRYFKPKISPDKSGSGSVRSIPLEDRLDLVGESREGPLE